jgi:hypothetical protein
MKMIVKVAPQGLSRPSALRRAGEVIWTMANPVLDQRSNPLQPRLDRRSGGHLLFADRTQ